MEKPWRKFWRKEILRHPVFRTDRTGWYVFEYLLLSADDTGTYIASYGDLAKQVGLNKDTVYKAVNRLREQTMCIRKSNGRTTIFSICNWKKWQGGSIRKSNDSATVEPRRSLTRKEKNNTATNVDSTTVGSLAPLYKEIENILNVNLGSVLPQLANYSGVDFIEIAKRLQSWLRKNNHDDWPEPRIKQEFMKWVGGAAKPITSKADQYHRSPYE